MHGRGGWSKELVALGDIHYSQDTIRELSVWSLACCSRTFAGTFAGTFARTLAEKLAKFRHTHCPDLTSPTHRFFYRASETSPTPGGPKKVNYLPQLGGPKKINYNSEPDPDDIAHLRNIIQATGMISTSKRRHYAGYRLLQARSAC